MYTLFLLILLLAIPLLLSGLNSLLLEVHPLVVLSVRVCDDKLCLCLKISLFCHLSQIILQLGINFYTNGYSSFAL